MIKILNLTKKYDDKVAVDNLSLTIEDGDIYAFVGLNGAGKSTTIKSIVGILDFDMGSIYINDYSIKEDPIKAKSILAYVADNPEIYSFMTGVEYVKFVLAMYNHPFDEAKMLELSKKLEIDKALADPISSYSHGMKQKIVLLASFLHEPKVLVLDEPFVGLDPLATHILKEMMKEYASKGMSIFFSTHVLDVAQKLCNKVAIIKEGKLVLNGTMESVIKDASLEDTFLGLNE